MVRAKASPGSVAVAAANQGPQGGSATKFMAKQSKQQAAANQNNPTEATVKRKRNKRMSFALLRLEGSR